MSADSDKRAETYAAFHDAVNMTPAKLEAFLGTEESRSVGQKTDGGEATGHREGRRIVTLLRTKTSDLGDDDDAHMAKVAGYVHRHREQGGPADKSKVKDSPWRLSLMNRGHDPLKGD